MKIALVGASGRVGSRLLTEMLRRGHEVTAIARSIGSVIPPDLHLTRKSADANEPSELAPVLRGHDIVVSAVKFELLDPEKLITAVKQAGVPRLMVVGGAGTLETASGTRLMDTPDFPEAYRAEAVAGYSCLLELRSERELDWTFVSPSAELVQGKRTGKYRVGGDQLLVTPDGKSWISMEDYAIAFVDELEKHSHSRQRFTVGY